jgi:hypothetical protein
MAPALAIVPNLFLKTLPPIPFPYTPESARGVAPFSPKDRERDMSALRKLAHRTGIWPDTVIAEGERDKARGERGLHKRQIKLGAMDRTEKCRRPPRGDGAERCAGGRRARNGRQAGAGGSSAHGIERD